MVFKKLFSNEKGVTPVVGVMLMVVVTVILAAAVSSYAGSMKTQDVAPQATLKSSASIVDGKLTIEHLGGDAIKKASINIELAGGKPYTSGYVDMASMTLSPNPEYFRPGDSLTIPFDVYDSFENYDPVTNAGIGDKTKTASFSGAGVSLEVYLGNTFKVTVIDKETGQTVCSSNIVMNP